MRSRTRYFVPLILAALLPLCGLAEPSTPQKSSTTHWALLKGKKGKKQKKQHKAPKAKHSKHSKRAPKSKH